VKEAVRSGRSFIVLWDVRATTITRPSASIID
jgi:hypothetical protein